MKQELEPILWSPSEAGRDSEFTVTTHARKVFAWVSAYAYEFVPSDTSCNQLNRVGWIFSFSLKKRKRKKKKALGSEIFFEYSCVSPQPLSQELL